MSDRVIGKNQNAVRPEVYRVMDARDRESLALSAKVNDDAIRQHGVAHDGYEKVFALVPKADGQWTRVDLEHFGMTGDRGGGPPSDSYHRMLDAVDLMQLGVRLEDVKAQGVAFGVEVSGPHGENRSTLWLQGFGDNYKPGGV